MTKNTENQMRRLHHSGVSLTEAWLRYAQPDLKAEWQELQKSSAIEALTKGAEVAANMEGDAATKFAHAFAGSQSILSARGNLERRLKANILSYVANGHLHGFGFELPRSLSSVPVTIPKAAWAGKCDWKSGTLSFRGLEFVDIRLTTNRIRNEILERGNVDMNAPAPVGRPSVSQDIKDAFNALAASGEIDTAKSLKSHDPKVRHWLELNRPNLHISPKYISNETIRKNISPLFKDLKKNQ